MEIQLRKHHLKAVFAKIQRVLMLHWDPIGVRGIAGAEDEYDSYVWPVYRLLLSKASDEEVKEYLVRIERETMGLRTLTNPDRLDEVVRLLRSAALGSISLPDE